MDTCSQFLFWQTLALICDLLALHCFTCVSLFSPRNERLRALGFMDSFGNASLISGNSAGALVRRVFARAAFQISLASFSLLSCIVVLWSLSLLSNPYDKLILLVNKVCFPET